MSRSHFEWAGLVAVVPLLLALVLNQGAEPVDAPPPPGASEPSGARARARAPELAVEQEANARRAGLEARGGDPLVDLDVTPHPASEQARSDARQHEIFAALTLALERLDVGRARALLDEHARMFPDGGWKGQRRGYELVLECLATGGDRKRFVGAAERYLEEERISPLRRSVRGVCLEGRAFRRRT